MRQTSITVATIAAYPNQRSASILWFRRRPADDELIRRFVWCMHPAAGTLSTRAAVTAPLSPTAGSPHFMCDEARKLGLKIWPDMDFGTHPLRGHGRAPASDGAPLAIEATGTPPADMLYRHQARLRPATPDQIPEKRDLIAGGRLLCRRQPLRSRLHHARRRLAARASIKVSLPPRFSGRFSRIGSTAAASRRFQSERVRIISGNPFRLDIADACRGGTNQLVIRFVNTPATS